MHLTRLHRVCDLSPLLHALRLELGFSGDTKMRVIAIPWPRLCNVLNMLYPVS